MSESELERLEAETRRVDNVMKIRIENGPRQCALPGSGNRNSPGSPGVALPGIASTRECRDCIDPGLGRLTGFPRKTCLTGSGIPQNLGARSWQLILGNREFRFLIA